VKTLSKLQIKFWSLQYFSKELSGFLSQITETNSGRCTLIWHPGSAMGRGFFVISPNGTLDGLRIGQQIGMIVISITNDESQRVFWAEVVQVGDGSILSAF
jgi:hypothetical protein